MEQKRYESEEELDFDKDDFEEKEIKTDDIPTESGIHLGIL